MVLLPIPRAPCSCSCVCVLFWCVLVSHVATLYRYVNDDFMWFGWDVRCLFELFFSSFLWFVFVLLLPDQLWLVVCAFHFALRSVQFNCMTESTQFTDGIASFWVQFCGSVRAWEMDNVKLTLELRFRLIVLFYSCYCFSCHCCRCWLNVHLIFTTLETSAWT